jgi:hypothetical protein
VIAALFIASSVLNAVMAYVIARAIVDLERHRAAERWLKVIDRMDAAIEQHTRDLTTSQTFTYSTAAERQKGIPCA